MGRTAPRASTMLGRFRRYFHLPQWEVAGLLRVSERTYEHLEAARRTGTLPVLERLLVLMALVPPDPVPNEAPPPAEPLAPLRPDHPDARGLAKLRLRIRYCRLHADRLRREADVIADYHRAPARRVAALETLRAQAAAPDAPPAVAEVLARFAQLETTPLAADHVIWHRKQATAAGLEAEAAVLEAALETAP